MMFETNHDGLNQFGDEAVRGRNAIYEAHWSQPELHRGSQCFADASTDLRVVGAEQGGILGSLNADRLRPKEKSDVIQTFCPEYRRSPWDLRRQRRLFHHGRL